MQIRYSKDAIKFLDRQPKNVVNRIREAISKLKLYPPVGDISIMKGYTDGRKRLRVSSFRVIYRTTTEQKVEILFIIDIGNRGDIYK